MAVWGGTRASWNCPLLRLAAAAPTVADERSGVRRPTAGSLGCLSLQLPNATHTTAAATLIAPSLTTRLRGRRWRAPCAAGLCESPAGTFRTSVMGASCPAWRRVKLGLVSKLADPPSHKAEARDNGPLMRQRSVLSRNPKFAAGINQSSNLVTERAGRPLIGRCEQRTGAWERHRCRTPTRIDNSFFATPWALLAHRATAIAKHA